MIKSATYSKRMAAVCLVGLGAAASISCLSRHITSTRNHQLRSLLVSEGELSRQIAALSEFGDANLASLRSTVVRLRLPVGAKDQSETLVKGFGDSWTHESGGAETKDGISLKTDIFKKLSPEPSDWWKTVETLRSLEEVPGITIVSFEMRTSGDRNHRSVDILRVMVESRTRGSI